MSNPRIGNKLHDILFDAIPEFYKRDAVVVKISEALSDTDAIELLDGTTFKVSFRPTLKSRENWCTGCSLCNSENAIHLSG